MAAIAIGDCDVTILGSSPWGAMVKLVTPSTADDTDTIDMSTIFEEIFFGFANSATDNNIAITNTTTTSIVLPGSTDNEARTCYILGNLLKSTGGST